MDHGFFDMLGDSARAAISGVTDLATENKAAGGAFDPVTEADKAAERALRALIEAEYPDHGIWGEEYGWSREGAAIHWSLDPIDGTRAFVCGLPSWSVLVGLLEQGGHIGGMIDLPALGERLIGIDGEAFLNGRETRTTGCATIAEARISTTDPALFDATHGEGWQRLYRAAPVKRYGLDAMAFARVATGGLDLACDAGLQPHDYDALVAVVRGAGGHVGNWRGGDDLTGGDVLAAASRQLYDEAVRLIAL